MTITAGRQFVNDKYNNTFFKENKIEEKHDKFPSSFPLLKLQDDLSLSNPNPKIISFFNDISIIDSWRLFIDGILQKIESGWLGFEEREPGYLFNILKAMAYALNHIDEPLDVEFIRILHKISLENVSNTLYKKVHSDEKPGNIRCMSANYGLTSHILSKKGLKEIIDKIHSNPFLSLGYNKEDKNIFNDPCLDLKATPQHKEEYIDALYEYIKKGGFIRIEMSFDKITNETQKIDYYVELHLFYYIDTYLSSINNAGNDINKKLSVILTFLQDCEHMHVFVDGNGRLFYMVLLYYLFIQNNLPLPVMFDNNRISGFSIDELIFEVKRGWENKDILAKTGALFGISTKDVLAKLTAEQLDYFISSLKSLTLYFKSGNQDLEKISKPTKKIKSSEIYSFWQPFPSTAKEEFDFMSKEKNYYKTF